MKRTVFGSQNTVVCAVIVWCSVGSWMVAGGQTVVPRPVRPATPHESAPGVADPLTIPADVPLRVEATQTVNLKPGQVFLGKLAEPVYGPDRLLLPANSVVHGVVASTPAADSSTRVNAKLDGDFTPLRVPVIRVTQIVLPSGAVLPIAAEGGMRNAATISLARHAKPTSIVGRVKDVVHQHMQQVRDSLHDPHKGDRLRQLLYSQLPYHPQRLWAGSSFDAVLTQPVELPAADSAAALPRASAVDLTSGTMEARLVSGVTSSSAKKGDAVEAVLVAPFCNQNGGMMLPAGTSLNGLVLQAKPARSFGRSGRLRFAFRSVGKPVGAGGEGTQHIESSLSSIQAMTGENVELDPEGGTRAQPDQGRFLAPLVLGVMAVASQDDESGVARQGVTSNGFGIFARVATMATASRNASTGFAAFAFSKSIYRRWIARGHEVSFPQNTELVIDLSKR